MTEHQLPPGEKWRQFELYALGFRDFAGVRPDVPLDPFRLAGFANLLVIGFEEIKGLSPLPTSHSYNPAHDRTSVAAR